MKLNTLYQLRWTNELIKILDIQIHNDMEIMIEQNYSPLLQKMRDIITIWKHRT